MGLLDQVELAGGAIGQVGEDPAGAQAGADLLHALAPETGRRAHADQRVPAPVMARMLVLEIAAWAGDASTVEAPRAPAAPSGAPRACAVRYDDSSEECKTWAEVSPWGRIYP